MRHFISPNMLDWGFWLCLAQFAINNAWHETTQQTPFFLNRGRAPRIPLDILLPKRGMWTTLHLANLLEICSSWLIVQESSPLLHRRGKSVTMMLSCLCSQGGSVIVDVWLAAQDFWY